MVIFDICYTTKSNIYPSLIELLKLMAAEFKLKPSTLWTLHAHGNISGWVKMIIDVIFHFRMSFCLLNTKCFRFPGISDDKGVAIMVWFEKNFAK